jgi:hypothetical protein
MRGRTEVQQQAVGDRKHQRQKREDGAVSLARALLLLLVWAVGILEAQRGVAVQPAKGVQQWKMVWAVGQQQQEVQREQAVQATARAQQQQQQQQCKHSRREASAVVQQEGEGGLETVVGARGVQRQWTHSTRVGWAAVQQQKQQAAAVPAAAAPGVQRGGLMSTRDNSSSSRRVVPWAVGQEEK